MTQKTEKPKPKKFKSLSELSQLKALIEIDEKAHIQSFCQTIKKPQAN